MAYRMRYAVWVDYFQAGIGPMGGYPTAAGGNVGPAPASGAQTLEFFANPPPVVAGAGTGNIITSGDITTLTTAMSADISAQLNIAATLARLQGFASGGT